MNNALNQHRRLAAGLATTLLACACSEGSSTFSGAAPVTASDSVPEVSLERGLEAGIGSLAIEVLGNGQAVVTWETENPTLGSVHYGLEGQSPEALAESGAPRAHHKVELTGLSPRSKYLVSIQASADSVPPAAPQALFYTTDDTLGDGLAAGVSGTIWEPFVLSFEGPLASETDDAPNPFLDYRLTVSFTSPSGQTFDVPGFFDGDGQGGGTGKTFKVRFAPDEAGLWSYTAEFVSGTDIAVSTSAGTPLAFDGASGTFPVQPKDASAQGFYALGILECTGSHYLRFRDGKHFLKGGTDSPENFLGYKGFDNTVDQPGGASTAGLTGGVHSFAPHVADWNPGDPYFVSEDTGWDSKGIIGALNYLSSKGVNSIYFLPMNLGGDGRETAPFVGYGNNAFDKTHYDISKLSQWNQVFVHAQEKGILLHVVLGETESGNENWLDGGTLGVERKLYYREMIARFSHALAIKWNISEESDFSTAQALSFSQYITDLDPHHRPVAFHTHLLSGAGYYSPYQAVLGNQLIGATSIQGQPSDAGSQVEYWRQQSADAGHKWVIDFDEQAPAGVGLTDTNASQLRKSMLWDVYFSGGQMEWYAGYHPLPLGGDMRLEDFRTRDEMWNYTHTARNFVEQLPFVQMQPADQLVTGESTAYGGAEVFCLPGKLYAVYYPSGAQTGTIDLSATSGWLNKRWFDPRTGTFLPGAQRIPGGGPHTVGPPPTVGSGMPGFQEQNGLFVIEMESTPASSGWSEENAYAGYTGSSYYRWAGSNYFSTPGNGILAYDLNVTTGGDYRLSVHNRHNNSQPDQENDCWVRVDGGTWIKLYSNAGSSTVGVWNWHSKFDLAVDVDAHFQLSPGPHRIEFSGRSYGFMIDRMHLYLPTVSNPLDLSLPESPQGAGTASSEDWVMLIRQT